jgi:NADH dehydrogenase [ubiquinone] 1 alpha subcomplex assembly factor 5
MNKEILFNRELLRQNQTRHSKIFLQHNFLFHEVANRIAENAESTNREFESLLEINPRDVYLSSLIKAKKKEIIADEESLFSEKENSFDLILSNLNFHFINEIPQFLLQVKNVLKPSGIFIASFFGEENLRELADVLFKAENEIYGGISPRMPPTIDVKTAANLLAKAGFQNPISDFEKIEVNYKNPLSLLKDLKMMGQANIMNKRSRKFFTKKFLEKILENYFNLYKTSDGGVLATFEVITITAWKNLL